MRFKLHNILLFLLLIIVFSCNTAPKNNTTYFVGQIVNPKEISIHLFKGENEISLTQLSAVNKFNFTLDNLTAGLYTFSHGVEFQYLYLEPNDSIIMRLNTWDFDESLVFSGAGAEKNNYLIQLFLKNEAEEKLFYPFYKLDEVAFTKKTDSLVNIKLNHYNKFKKHTKVSSAFNELVQKAIYYPIYSIKEKYVENYKRYHKLKKSKPLSNHFYAYRKNIDINDSRFLNYYAYSNYIGNYLLNIAAKIKEKDNSQRLSVIVLEQVNQKIKNESLKNTMLHHAIINCLLDKNCHIEDKEKAKRIFYENCTDKKKVNTIKKMVNSLELLKKGSTFPSLNAINSENKNIFLDDLKSNQKLVLYFWPKEPKRIHNMAKRVNYLSHRHENIQFIGLDNQLDNKVWKTHIKTNKLPIKNQYQLVDTTKNKWFTNEIPRAIILDKNGIIQNDFTYLSHRNFEKILLQSE
ncbi:MAG: peroxiredoxin family protein [Flavobacteriaceae bacterium]|nr:peroxiredoxin family protein [Flavobacteriaceae bacterium]